MSPDTAQTARQLQGRPGPRRGAALGHSAGREARRLRCAPAARLAAGGRPRPAAEGGAAEKKNAIFIYLDGGQSQMDSWDPKPDGGDAAGEFKPIATNLDGLQVCEHMPHLAKVADTYAVLRSVKDAIAVHGIGMKLVRTGNRPQASLVYPDVGSVICRERVSPKGIPPFVSLPVVRTNSTTE